MLPAQVGISWKETCVCAVWSSTNRLDGGPHLRTQRNRMHNSSPATCTERYTGAWDWVVIMIPPGFTVPDVSQVVTSFTNDYSNAFVTKAGPYDRFAPGWTEVYIAADAGQSASGLTAANTQTPYYNHQRIQFTSLGEWYYIRINGVTAPATAGRYFFKVLLGNGAGAPGYYIAGNEGTYSFTPPYDSAVFGESLTQFIPTENWPVLLVKGEIDPAIITGTIRYAGYNQTLYSQPVGRLGKVEAIMTTRLDPYTGQHVRIYRWLMRLDTSTQQLKVTMRLKV